MPSHGLLLPPPEVPIIAKFLPIILFFYKSLPQELFWQCRRKRAKLIGIVWHFILLANAAN
jgi:hypothetical protein